MKPQALKVVEFPERILNEGQGHVEVSKSASEGHSASSSSRQQQQQQLPRVTGESQSEAVLFLSNHGNTPQAFTNNVVAMTTIQIDSVVMSPGQIEAMSRSLNDADTDEGDSKASSAAGSPKVSSLPASLPASLPESLDRKSLRLCHVVDDPTLPPPLSLQQQHPLVAGTGNRQRTKLEPPRTLNVREVSKLSKGVFTLPSTCMSAESIGPCSLDVSSIGTGKVTPHPPEQGATLVLGWIRSVIVIHVINWTCSQLVAHHLKSHGHLHWVLLTYKFGYREHLAVTSNFFLRKGHLLLTSISNIFKCK